VIAFGPVPSRRLGRSLGINNIPPKVCTYSCTYCQLGRTPKMRAERQAFYKPEMIVRAVQDRIAKAGEAGEPIDYLTFVPDGEPTLDINLGCEIDLLKPFGVSIGVITNSSLMWREGVREALIKADWVSLKVDSVQDDVWRRVDRPHGALRLDSVLDGALKFAREFDGQLVTETMLVEGVNDGSDHIRAVAGFLAELQPSVIYLSIPTRPPAEKWVCAPCEAAVNRAYQIVNQEVDVDGKHPAVEYLIGYEGNAFAFTGDVEQDLLSITSVHPMREDAVIEFLKRADADWSVVDTLLARGQLVVTEYGGGAFYLRRLQRAAEGRGRQSNGANGGDVEGRQR
jgi:wyosine [tRNA(Phe)-imidazoG37] synthetase (radical SAM superfamily)